MIGRFISIEGPDCCGKSTNIPILRQALVYCGYDVVLTREPGGSPLGEKIRTLLLNEPMAPMTELLLFAAARNEHIEKTIIPAINEGKVVISDRFSDSSYAYQGSGRGLREEVLTLEDMVHENIEPDYTLFFTASKETIMQRMTERAKQQGKDRFESEELEFKERVLNGYNECFSMYPHRMHAISAEGTREEVANLVLKWVRNVFVPANPL